MVQSGDVVGGAGMQVLLASVGSITFAPTAGVLLNAADVGIDVSLDAGTLIRTVALLQLVPFAIGLLMRRYAAPTAQSWHPAAASVSNITFLIVLVGSSSATGKASSHSSAPSPSSPVSCSLPPPSPLARC
ncbi:hypothetical protein [Streptomyces sp. NPDC007206]|uniref:hypothetical protein n=1 Tax=Streptomyces sp. NPDC007206 TaxID=3154317 RepID=UPI0033DB5BF3